MSYTPVDGPISTAYTDLADGDDLDAASVRVWLEALSDSMEYMRLHGLKQVFGQDYVSLPDGFAATRTIAGFGATSAGLPVVPGVLNNIVPVSGSVYFPVDLPNECELNVIAVKINPADDALPTTNIRLQLWRVDVATGTASSIQSVTDPLTGASYQAIHDLTLTLSSPQTIDNTLHSYHVVLVGESGGDADDVVIVSAPRLTRDVATLDLGR
jgi:hypothetical protein